MATGSETQTRPNISWRIPEDWAAELQSGHVILVPANTHVGTLSQSGYIVYTHDEQSPAHAQIFGLYPDKLREAFGFLEQTGYTYQGFRHCFFQDQQDQGEDATAHQRELAIAQYRDRLAALRDAAEEEGISWNEASEQDFLAFTADNPHWRKAGLALMDNGNLRAVWEWEDDDETHLALQFLGARMVQFVIFKRRLESVQVSRMAGTDTFSGINPLVMAFELTSLVCPHDKL